MEGVGMVGGGNGGCSDQWMRRLNKQRAEVVGRLNSAGKCGVDLGGAGMMCLGEGIVYK